MLISQAFPSKYLKSEDIGDRTVRVIMDYVEICDVGDGEHKPVLYFQGKEKGMVLNVTNANAVSAIYGDETSDWSGQELVVYVDKNVNFKGKRVDGLRVRPPLPKEVERDMRVVNPNPVRRVANGGSVAMPQATYAAPAIDTNDVPF
jgi:hypothetical protein